MITYRLGKKIDTVDLTLIAEMENQVIIRSHTKRIKLADSWTNLYQINVPEVIYGYFETMFNFPTDPDSFKGNFAGYKIKMKSIKYINGRGEEVEAQNPDTEIKFSLESFEGMNAGVLQFENRVNIIQSKTLVRDESKWRNKGILNMALGHSVFKGVDYRVEDFFCESAPFRNFDMKIFADENSWTKKSGAFYQ